MSQFADNLRALPEVENLAALELVGEGSDPDARIENRPGQQGSLRIYYSVAVDFGGIGPTAAHKALELFAEKADEARAEPGSHPNIDRLFDIIERDIHYAVRAVPKDR
jgi:hypothetical protein